MRAARRRVAGYLFVAVPMLLFLVLNIGALLYAVYISVWRWNLRTGPVTFLGLKNYQNVLGDPTFQRAVQNSLYYAVVWVPLTMAVGLFLAVIVNQKIRGQTFFRASFYFPAIASSAAITTLWIFIVAPDGLFNGIRAALGLNPLFTLFGFAPDQNWIHDQDTALNSVIILNAWTTSGTFMLFYLASLQSISRRGLRGGRDRRRRRLADVLEDHLPAPPAGPLLRGDGRGHRGAPAVRPGDLRRRRERRPEQRPDDAWSCTSTTQAFKQFNFEHGRGRGRRPVRRHLLGDARPAPPVRPGPGMVRAGPMTADAPAADRPRAGRGAAIGPVGPARVVAPPDRLRRS